MARITYDSVEYNAFSVTAPRPTVGFDYNGGLEKRFEQWGLQQPPEPEPKETPTSFNTGMN
jgi:hypothetical protein